MMIQIVKRFLTSGVRSSLRNLQWECQTLRKHRTGVRKARRFREATGLHLQLGSGPKVKQGWVNIDLGPHADLTLDLREPLPFRDSSCSLIYSEHFLEHVEYPTGVLSLLRECHRVLQPGGRFSAGVPDTEWPLLEYGGVKQENYFSTAKRRWHPKWCETEMEHINYHFRQGAEHLFAYDFETLSHVLRKAGFGDVTRRTFDPSLDSKDRELGTLYVDAFKP